MFLLFLLLLGCCINLDAAHAEAKFVLARECFLNRDNKEFWIRTLLFHRVCEVHLVAYDDLAWSIWTEHEVFAVNSIEGNKVFVGPSIIDRQELGVQGSGSIRAPDTYESIIWVFHKAREKFLNEKPGHKFTLASYDLQPVQEFLFNKEDLPAELVGPGEVENEQKQKAEIKETE